MATISSFKSVSEILGVKITIDTDENKDINIYMFYSSQHIRSRCWQRRVKSCWSGENSAIQSQWQREHIPPGTTASQYEYSMCPDCGCWVAHSADTTSSASSPHFTTRLVRPGAGQCPPNPGNPGPYRTYPRMSTPGEVRLQSKFPNTTQTQVHEQLCDRGGCPGGGWAGLDFLEVSSLLLRSSVLVSMLDEGRWIINARKFHE